LSGTFAAPNATYSSVIIDVYLLDLAALGKTNYWPKPLLHPGTWLGAYRDNGPGDLNPAANEFSINLSSFGLSTTSYVAVAVSYSQDASSFNAGRSVTSPMSNPISARPLLTLRRTFQPDNVELSWLGPPSAYFLQINPSLSDPGNWFELFPEVYTGGRSTYTLSFDSAAPANFFRLISQ
jgi:hypothetical protein